MRLLLLACAILLATDVPAFAWYCSEPTAPSCATRYGAFFDEYEFNRCRREVTTYGEEVETYLACLQRESNETVSEYNDAIDAFNRRARSAF